MKPTPDRGIEPCRPGKLFTEECIESSKKICLGPIDRNRMTNSQLAQYSISSCRIESLVENLIYRGIRGIWPDAPRSRFQILSAGGSVVLQVAKILVENVVGS